jgi:hypothetical protein
MRENTGSRTVTTTNFVTYADRTETATSTWTPEQAASAEDTLALYTESYLTDSLDADGYALNVEVFEYQLPGLTVTALVEDGTVQTVFTVSDDDMTRLHTAARTGRTLKIRYVKTDGSVSRREVEVQSVRLSKAGDVIVRAFDRKADDTRSFRADRITHTTLHRATAPVRPTKAALAAEFQATIPAGECDGTGRRGSCNILEHWDFQNGQWVHTATPSVPAFIPAPRPALEESAAWFLYDTTPGSPAALEAPESVQDKLADAFASGQRYVKVYA